ncbi:DUF4236 domain-containing protein [Streptomyces sp. NBC_00433]
MPITFRKSFRIFPGVRVNIGRRSRSITIGPKWFKKTFSSTGRTTTSADLPGPFGWRTSRRRRD